MIMERNPKREEHSTRLGPKTASVVGGLLAASAPSQHVPAGDSIAIGD
jgi:hypothetical protein